MRTKNEIIKRYKRAIDFLFSDECIGTTGTAVKTFHTIRELYWILGGEGHPPITIFPEKKIVDKEKLYSVIEDKQ